MYGDPKKMDLGDFDILDDVAVMEAVESRKKQMEAYESNEVKHPSEGKVVNVVYLGINGQYLVFDGGFKDYVRIDNRPNESKYLKNTNVGDSVDVFVTEINNTNFIIKGSISEIYESKARKSLTSLQEGVSVKAYVRELTPAGYNIDLNYEGVTLPGFMPNTLAGINKLHDQSSILGKTFDVMIESFSRDEGTYIVSRRKYLQTLIPQSIKELEYGVVYTGHVTGTTDFGVFVEFKECLTGMIHKTNIDPEWADKLSSISPGFEIEFYIKETVKDKIILTQILRESLWDTIKVGQIFSGKIRDIKSFGALVILDDETNGLIHTSEMEKSSRRLSTGEQVKVRVIAVDRMSRKIFLSVS